MPHTCCFQAIGLHRGKMWDSYKIGCRIVPYGGCQGCIVAPIPVKGVLIADSASFEQIFRHLTLPYNTCHA